MSQQLSFDDLAAAMRLHDLMKQIADNEINELRPLHRYGFVQDIDVANRKCTVRLNGQDSTVVANLGHIAPVAPEQLVRVSGVVGDFFISDVFDANGVSGVSLPRASIVKGAFGTAVPAGTNYCEVSSSGFTHNQKGQWLDLPWQSKNTWCVEDDGMMIDVGGIDFTAPLTATYMVDMGFTFQSGGVTPALYAVRLVYSDTGRVLRQVDHDAADSGSRIMDLQWFGRLAKGQLVKFQAYQDGNTSLAIIGQQLTFEFGARIQMVSALPA